MPRWNGRAPPVQAVPFPAVISCRGGLAPLLPSPVLLFSHEQGRGL
jgi:hypothetical protein